MSIPRDTYVGEPGYPDPWTTKQPREGLRDIDEAKVVSLSPDVCWTPVGSSVVAIPYPIVDFCGHDENYTPSVRFTGKKAMVLRSRTTHVHGDAPGVKKGVKSGTVESISEPVGYADHVRAEGSNVIRHLDRFKMNNGNTEGEAIFVKRTQTYAPPIDNDPVPGSLRWTAGSGDGRVLSDASPEPLIMGAQYAQAAPLQSLPSAPLTSSPGSSSSPTYTNNVIQGPWKAKAPPVLEERTSPATVAGWLRRFGEFAALAAIMLIPGDTPLIPPLPYGADPVERDLNRRANTLLDPLNDKYNRAVQKWYLEQLEDYRRYKREKEEKETQVLPQSETVRVTEREEYRKKCQVDRYAKMKNICGQYGMQAHHIVPDWTLRYGARDEDDKRIPNMPSLNDGMAICVIGNAREKETEHWEGHLADKAIEEIGKNAKPPFTAPLSRVAQKSAEAMIKVRPDCSREILTALAKQFSDKNPNQLLRAKQYPPLPQDTISALKTGAVAGGNIRP